MTEPAALPLPLVDISIDIRALDSFMLNVDRMLSSELWALSNGEEFKAAFALWMRAWKQTPAGSLPDDDRVLSAFSGAGKRWLKVREMALRGFVKCSDGRLYHQYLCEDVVRAAAKMAERRDRTKAATEARKRERDVGRNVERDVAQMPDVTSSHIERDQGQGQGQGFKEEEDEQGAPPNDDAPISKSNRGTRLPHDWALPEKWGTWAIGRGASIEMINHEAEIFANYWPSQAGAKAVKLDWFATWRNWMLRKLPDQPPAGALLDRLESQQVRGPELDHWRDRMTGCRRANYFWPVGNWGPLPSEPNCECPSIVLAEFPDVAKGAVK